MTKIHLRFVVEDVDRHGNVRRYFRRKGQPKIRLLGQPCSPEFMNAYQIALGEERLPTRKKASQRNKQSGVGTLKWLCEAYLGFAEFKRLDPRTKRVRRNILDNLCRENGDKPVRLMEPRHVRSIRDERAERPEAANATLKALRQIFAYGVATELVDRNPVPYLKSSSQGFHSWTDDEVAQVRSYASGRKQGASSICPPVLYRPTPIRCDSIWATARTRWTHQFHAAQEPQPEANLALDTYNPGLTRKYIGFTLRRFDLFGDKFRSTVFGGGLRQQVSILVRSSWIASLLGSRPAKGRCGPTSRAWGQRTRNHGRHRPSDFKGGF